MSWMFDDIQATIDLQENEDGVNQIRHHVVIQRHKIIDAHGLTGSLQIGQELAAINGNIGSIELTYDPTGTGSFICIGDSICPVENPANFLRNTQTWEWFGKWIDCPSQWQS